jgi:flagellar motor switch/type III secretory pathway protein FliN
MKESAFQEWAEIPFVVAAVAPARPMRVRDILALRAGVVVSTTRAADGPVDIYAGDTRIGAGELSVNGARASVRVQDVGRR